jgi:hypothetical protein
VQSVDAPHAAPLAPFVIEQRLPEVPVQYGAALQHDELVEHASPAHVVEESIGGRVSSAGGSVSRTPVSTPTAVSGRAPVSTRGPVSTVEVSAVASPGHSPESGAQKPKPPPPLEHALQASAATRASDCVKNRRGRVMFGVEA